jgi:alpha-D-xyloside xylohydrolase
MGRLRRSRGRIANHSWMISAWRWKFKYKLLPYIYTQAQICSEQGYPLVRALFFEFPQDATSWYIEDEYMLGTSMLVAPLMEDSSGRNIYLPAGKWVDYQTGQVYAGSTWHYIEAGEIPIIILVIEGTAILHLKSAAQTTSHLDWSQIECRVYAASQDKKPIHSSFFHPEEQKMYEIELQNEKENYQFSRETMQIIKEEWHWEIHKS